MLCLLAAALVYIRFVEAPAGGRAAAGPLVAGTSAEDLRRIEIRNPSGSFTLVNAAGDTADRSGWRIDGLPDARLDAPAMAELLAAVQELSLTDSFSPDGDLGQYGLATPALSLTIHTTTARAAIEIGARSEYLERRFMRINGGSVLYTVPERLAQAALKPHEDFRDRRVLRFDASAVKRIVIARQEGPLELARSPGGWRLVEGGEYPADAASVEALLQAAQALQVKAFFPDPGRCAAAPLRLMLALADGSSHPLSFSALPGAAAAPLFACTETESFELEPAALARFPLSSFELRKKRFTEVEPQSIVSLSLERQKEPMLLLRDDRGWSVNGRPGDEVFIRRFLDELAWLEAVQFPPEQACRFDDPTLRIAITTSSGRSLVVIIGNRVRSQLSGEELYCAFGAEGTIPYLVAAAAVRRLSPSIEMLSNAAAGPA